MQNTLQFGKFSQLSEYKTENILDISDDTGYYIEDFKINN